jgi:hypothetical protein
VFCKRSLRFRAQETDATLVVLTRFRGSLNDGEVASKRVTAWTLSRWWRKFRLSMCASLSAIDASEQICDSHGDMTTGEGVPPATTRREADDSCCVIGRGGRTSATPTARWVMMTPSFADIPRLVI